jgi:hypothetical protein
MKTLEQLYGEEYNSNLYAGVLPEETPVQRVLSDNKPTVQNMPQSAYEKGLELAGIGVEQAATFLESLGSINIGGVDFTLRDLMPVDTGTSEALKTAGSGMPLTVGSGLQTRLKPEFGKAGAELSLLGPAGKLVEKGVTKVAKTAIKNKAKLATGTATISASEASKQKAEE